MSVIRTGVKAHDDVCTKSEGIRQVAVAAAAGNMAAVRAAEITHYRACLASALANGCGATTTALRELGTGGQ